MLYKRTISTPKRRRVDVPPPCFGYALYHYLHGNYPHQIGRLELPNTELGAYLDLQNRYVANRENEKAIFQFDGLTERQSALMPVDISVSSAGALVVQPRIDGLPNVSFLFYYFSVGAAEGHTICVNRMPQSNDATIWDSSDQSKLTLKETELANQLESKMLTLFQYQNPKKNAGSMKVQTICYG